MRSRIWCAVLVIMLGGSPAFAGEEQVRDAVWKFSRGLGNVATGLPGELFMNTLGGMLAPHVETLGATFAGFFAGVLVGTAKGVIRTGSGIVDMATFPVPFNDNRPLVEPDFAW